jgi:hypothetical protein
MRKISMDEKQKNKAIKHNRQPLQKQENIIERPKEIGGPKGPEPTRYGDWEKGGRCIDF